MDRCKRKIIEHDTENDNDDALDKIEQYCAEELLKRKRPDVVIYAAREGVEISF